MEPRLGEDAGIGFHAATQAGPERADVPVELRAALKVRLA